MSTSWPLTAVSLPGSWRCTGRNNDEMVDKFVHMGVITGKEVEEAFRAVPRGAFVPSELQVEAYIDSPLRGEPHVHMSAPHMYATVLEALDLSPGLSFLNIGSGTGYFSCLAGCILQSQGINHGIELHEDLVEFARDRVNEYLRFSPTVAREICPPKFIAGNCFRLDASMCNYDRVYCGAACSPSKVPFILGLTKIGGFAIIPCRNRLLKIERISTSGVKQSCISDVCFASLATLPENESSLPKLYFPPETPRRKEKRIQVFPPSNVLVSRSQARTLLARLRALQQASVCLQNCQPIPLAFCYVPSYQQMQQYFEKRVAPHEKSATVVTSPVDRKIGFFSSQRIYRENLDGGISCSQIEGGHDWETEGLWHHLQEDRLWETVLEYYYSLCNVSNKKQQEAMNVYIRFRVKRSAKRQEGRKTLSYAALAHKLGIVNAQAHSQSLCHNVDATCTTAMTDSKITGEMTAGHTQQSDTSRCALHEKSARSDSEMKCQGSVHIKSVADRTTNSHPSQQHSRLQWTSVLIEMEKLHIEKLSCLPLGRWSIIEDLALVRFLCDINSKSNQGRCKGWFKLESVAPELFSQARIMDHPRLSGYSPEDLTYRAIVLCRIAKILDSVLYVLNGPSLLKGQNMYASKYQLESFNESSFASSWKPSDSGNLSPLSNKDAKPPVTEKVPALNRSNASANQSTRQLETGHRNNKLHKGLLDRDKEELKFVKKQIRLIEEEMQLLVKICEQGFPSQELALDQGVSDLKLHRQEAQMRQKKLKDLQLEQDQNKTKLLVLLKKVQDEERQLTKKLDSSVETDTTENLRLSRKGSRSEAIDYSDKWTVQPVTNQGNGALAVRYHLSALLSKMRFLLPLCSLRWRLVQELLQSSELSAPDYMPVITIDRRVPLSERHTDYRHSVFLQVHRELRAEKLHFRWNKWKYDQWWEVKFVGEGIIDQGGGFRDSLVEIAEELCPPRDNLQDILPYFIRSPNHKEKTGDYQDCFIPNPSCGAFDMYRWLGCVMGGVYRSDESLTLSFPPFIWKLLVGEHVTWAKDFVTIDEATVHITDELEVREEAVYQDVYGGECTFCTVLSDGNNIELLPGGKDRPVKCDDRQQYTSLVRRARMTEFTKQVQAIRQGLMSVVPESVLNLLTWSDLETGVCGDPVVSLTQLKTACKYGDNLTESSESVKHLWTVLAQFTSRERSQFLRFVTGRKRIPAPFTVAKAGGELDRLPHASTCASTLFLSEYSSSNVAREKLKYAISNCVAIDTDTSPW